MEQILCPENSRKWESEPEPETSHATSLVAD